MSVRDGFLAKYKVLKKQNSSKSCLVCGTQNELGLKADFYELENGELVSICNTKDWHQSYPGRVHGGMSLQYWMRLLEEL